MSMRGPVNAGNSSGFSEACERNKDFILEILRDAFVDCAEILEIGSGTGQHVIHFSRALPRMTWQPTDTLTYLDGLSARVVSEAPDNVEAPLALDVRMNPWPVTRFDGIFSANTLHFMSWSSVCQFFRGVGQTLADPGVLCVYGPFRYGGEFTTESNARFDSQLRQMDSQKGIRDFEAVNKLAIAEQLEFVRDVEMPANNQILIWRR
jgi:cyclopropane fatty-acyl-phospholipid synthase-like methyltransferase